MSNALTTVPAQLPAYLQKYRDQTQGINDGAIGGIKATSWPRINIGGSKFSIVRDGEKVLITDPSNPQLPKMQLEVVVVGHNPAVNKIFYDGAWQEGDTDEPDCSSDDGVRPDAHIASPQSSACATCPKNQWGSKISEQGKQIKACSDNKRLVVLPIHDLNSEPLEFTIKPSSLKEWANYVRGLSSRGIDVTTCVTNVFFDPAANYPKLLFRFGRFLTEEELATAVARMDDDAVKVIAMPRTTRAPAPVPGAQPAPVAPQPAPAPAAAATPAPAPVAPAPVAIDPFAGQPAHVKPAVDAAGGISSPGGAAVYKALTGKDVPTEPAPQPAPAPVAPPPPADPYEGQPAHVKAAVDASGGLDSDAGKAVYKSLTGKDAPGAEATKKRGRKAAATPAAQPAPAPAPAPAAAPVAPPPASPSFAAAPEQTAPAGGLGESIDALLAKALNTPTA